MRIQFCQFCRILFWVEVAKMGLIDFKFKFFFQTIKRALIK
jgi:hypothetical protein